MNLNPMNLNLEHWTAGGVLKKPQQTKSDFMQWPMNGKRHGDQQPPRPIKKIKSISLTANNYGVSSTASPSSPTNFPDLENLTTNRALKLVMPQQTKMKFFMRPDGKRHDDQQCKFKTPQWLRPIKNINSLAIIMMCPINPQHHPFFTYELLGAHWTTGGATAN